VTLSFGIIIGAGIGKAIYDRTQENSVVLMVAMVIAVCLIFYTLVLPESRPKEIRIAEAGRICTPSTLSSKEPRSFLSKLKQLLKQTLEPLLLFLPGRIKPIDNELPTRYTLLLLVGAYACGQFANTGRFCALIAISFALFFLCSWRERSYFWMQTDNYLLTQFPPLYFMLALITILWFQHQ
jgi:hypothetical protein